MNEAMDPQAQREPLSLDTLLAMTDDARLAYLQRHRSSVAPLVRELKDRTFRLLDADPTRALALAEVALQFAAHASDRASLPLAQRGYAQALHAGDRYADAVSWYRRAVAGYEELGDAVEAARSTIGMVEALMYLGHYDDALIAARRARETFLAHGDTRRAARLDVNIGNVLHRLDRPAEALAAYDNARSTFEGFADPVELALVDHNRGNVLSALNRFEEALAAYAAAAAVYQAQDLDADLAQTTYNRSYLSYLRGQFGLALSELSLVRRLFTGLGDRRHLALCDLDEAEILLNLNRLVDARALAGHAAATFDALEMRYEAAKARAFAAVAAMDSGNISEGGCPALCVGHALRPGRKCVLAGIRAVAAGGPRIAMRRVFPRRHPVRDCACGSFTAADFIAVGARQAAARPGPPSAGPADRRRWGR